MYLQKVAPRTHYQKAPQKIVSCPDPTSDPGYETAQKTEVFQKSHPSRYNYLSSMGCNGRANLILEDIESPYRYFME